MLWEIINKLQNMTCLGNTRWGHTTIKWNVSRIIIETKEVNHTIFFSIIFSGPHQEFSPASIDFPVAFFLRIPRFSSDNRSYSSHTLYPILCLCQWKKTNRPEEGGTVQRSRIFWHTHEVIPAEAVLVVWHLCTFPLHFTSLRDDTGNRNTTDCQQCNKIFT